MKKFIFLSSLIFIIFSCTKDYDQNLKCSDSKTFKTPQIIKDFFYFKPGTWWVYENTVTGAYDSMWVGEGFKELSTDSDKKKECNCGFGYCSEKYTTKIYNLEYNMNSEDELKRTSYADIYIYKKFVTTNTDVNYTTWDVSIECINNKYPVVLITLVGDKFDEQKNDHFQNYINNTFSNNGKLIGKTYLWDQTVNNKLTFRLAFSSHIGVFQFFEYKTGNLLLKRWHIVQ